MKGVYSRWSDAMNAAVFLAGRTSRRHTVRPFMRGWVVREVGA